MKYNEQFFQLPSILLIIQAALDEERRMVQDRLSTERHQMAKAREEMLAEQRRIIAECYEEKRKLAEERNQLAGMQRELYDRHSSNVTSQRGGAGGISSTHDASGFFKVRFVLIENFVSIFSLFSLCSLCSLVYFS